MDAGDVSLVDLDLGGDYRHVGERHQGAADGVLDAFDDRLALVHRQIGHDAIEGRDADRQIVCIHIAHQCLLRAGQLGAGRGGGGIGLRQ